MAYAQKSLTAPSTPTNRSSPVRAAPVVGLIQSSVTILAISMTR
jgi:hypothetical protein